MLEIQDKVLDTLVQRATENTARAGCLVDQLEQLDQLDQPLLDDALREMIAQRRAALEHELAQLILSWRRMGGRVCLNAEGLQTAPTRVQIEPEPEPEEAPDPQWTRVLASLLRKGRHHKAYTEELAAIGAVLEAVDQWPRLPRRAQSTLIEWLTARLRHLQTTGDERDWRVEQGFSVLTRYSRSRKPGFCYGLARDHCPRDESWAADAVALRERLRDAMGSGEATPADSQRMLSELQELGQELELAPDVAQEAVRSQLLGRLQFCLDEGLLARDPLLVALATPQLEQLDGPHFKALRRAILDKSDRRI